MSAGRYSRREALCTLGTALFAGVVAPRAGSHAPTADGNPTDASFIDAHIHLVKTRLPGALDEPLPIAPFRKDDVEGPKRLARTIEEETKQAGVAQALCMPRF